MTIGPPSRLTCPHCGGYKYILSIASGNTFRGTVWSDSKRDYPMLPRPSDIQYCAHCGKYFFYDDAKRTSMYVDRENKKICIRDFFEGQHEVAGNESEAPVSSWRKIQDEADANGFGRLSFEHADAAYVSLHGTLPEEREKQLLFLWLFGFNDKYERRGVPDISACPEGVLARRKEVIRGLIAMKGMNDLFVAEMYRELGDFAKCIEIASSLLGKDKESDSIIRQFIRHAEDSDSMVFQIVMGLWVDNG